jgi:hypothetical protein
MCGRFTLKATPEALKQLFSSLFDGLELQPQFNVAPSQQTLAVRLRPGTTDLEAVRLRWGLIPSWAKDPKIGYRLINARLDTVREKPSFRSAYKHRHCLILADGFYEWKKIGAKKTPYHIHLKNGQPFGFAKYRFSTHFSRKISVDNAPASNYKSANHFAVPAWSSHELMSPNSPCSGGAFRSQLIPFGRTLISS